jgi:hypothetical protein
MTTSFVTRFYRYMYLASGGAFFFVWFYFAQRDFSWCTFLQGYDQPIFYLTLAHSIVYMGLTDTLLNYSRQTFMKRFIL